MSALLLATVALLGVGGADAAPGKGKYDWTPFSFDSMQSGNYHPERTAGLNNSGDRYRPAFVPLIDMPVLLRNARAGAGAGGITDSSPALDPDRRFVYFGAHDDASPRRDACQR